VVVAEGRDPERHQRRRVGAVSPFHLPERMWDAANRRSLTRIESAERTQIVLALRESDGYRSKAATLLGIGRTTLYRKLHALGIDDEALLS
jgi:transcriptional regulator of acetoin/glycerol metabolism